MSEEDSKSGENKRRSAVFGRLSAIRGNEQDLDFDFDSSNESKRMKFREYKEAEKQVFDTRGYIESLQKEITEWKNIRTKQKNELVSLRRVYRDKKEQNLDLSILLDSDREFLANQPNYEEFVSQVHELKKVATEVACLNLQHSRLESNLTELLESEIEDVSRCMIKLID